MPQSVCPEPAAIATDRKVRQHFSILVLTYELRYFSPNLVVLLQDCINLFNQSSLLIRFATALKAILYPCFIKTIQEETAHVHTVGCVAIAKRVRDGRDWF